MIFRDAMWLAGGNLRVFEFRIRLRGILLERNPFVVFQQMSPFTCESAAQIVKTQLVCFVIVALVNLKPFILGQHTIRANAHSSLMQFPSFHLKARYKKCKSSLSTLPRRRKLIKGEWERKASKKTKIKGRTIKYRVCTRLIFYFRVTLKKTAFIIFWCIVGRQWKEGTGEENKASSKKRESRSPRVFVALFSLAGTKKLQLRAIK